VAQPRERPWPTVGFVVEGSASGTSAGSTDVDVASRSRAGGAGLLRDVWRLVRETVSVCFRYRVTGLAAEAGFFALLSLPPVVLGLVGSIGYLGRWFSGLDVDAVQDQIIDLTRRFLTESSVQEVIVPTLNDVFQDGRFDLISIGFVVALWSGSRALNVYVDTITIMYGLSGHRGIIRTRALSFTLYVVGLMLAVICVPLVLAGPSLVADALPPSVEVLNALYWPVVLVLTVAFLTSLYHVSVPVRVPWRRGLPGAALAMAIWIGGSFLLRWVITVSVGGTSIYGPLASPIIVLIWLYVLAIAVLIGAALNAATDRIWPVRETASARRQPGEVVEPVDAAILTPILATPVHEADPQLEPAADGARSGRTTR
jgi:membrane protein